MVDTSSEADESLDENFAVQRRRLEKKKKKKSLVRKTPLGLGRASATSAGLSQVTTSTDEHKLSSCLALLERLPKNSAFAKHRIKVVEKAISLLRISR